MQTEFEGLLRDTTRDGRTVLLSSHSLDEVQRAADRVAIIREGRLVVIDTVRRLRANAPRILRLRFDGEVDPSIFSSLPGVEGATARDGQIELRLTGELRPVLETALAHPLVDLSARHADLDELFRSYYAAPTAAPEEGGP
jgi:ABC-2 type transport system ATP-binding protein